MMTNPFGLRLVSAVSSTAATLGGYGSSAAGAGIIATVNLMFPDLKAILKSLQEKKFSTTFIRSIRENMLGKLRQSDLMSQRLSIYFQDNVPFLDIDSSFEKVDPEQVSQFKKILNALYYVERALEIIEKNPLDTSVSNANELLPLLIELLSHAHELIHIISRLDVNVSEYFSDEITQFSSLVSVCRQYAGPQVDDFLNGAMWRNLQKKAALVGHYTGVAADQLQSHTGQTDFHFLTTFGGVLSGHLSALTAHIRSYASSSVEQTPLITQEKISELTFSADELYRKLAQLQASGVSDPMNISAMLQHPFVYKEIFGHITLLSTSILNQMNNVHSGTQDALINQLSELKNKHLLDLFCFIDKIELYGAFKPGALSKPTLKYLKTWYGLLVLQAGSVVDVNLVRPDLLVIEDSQFVHARMENMLSRLATITTNELNLINVSNNMHSFFEKTDAFSQHGLPLSEMARADKAALLLHYQFIRPFMLQKDPVFDLRLLRDLGHVMAQNVTEEPPVSFSDCDYIKIHTDMVTALAKSKKSQEFYRSLAEDMIEGIFSRVDTLVLPYTVSGKNPFIIDESQMLGMTKRQPLDPRSQWFSQNEPLLLTDSCLDIHENMPRLYEGYRIYMYKLAFAKKACEDFQTQLSAHDWRLHKPALRNLYVRIQPYLMHVPLIINATEAETAASRAELDRAVIDCLQETHTPSADEQGTLTKIRRLITATLVEINRQETNARIRGERFTLPTQSYLSQQVQACEIKLDPIACKRVHHVFSHERYSEMIHQLSDSVRAMIPLFSSPIRKALATAGQNGLPFPGIDNDVELLKTSDQIILLKQLMNALYYLEDFFKQMEKLKNTNVTLIETLRQANFAKFLEFVGNHQYLFKATLAFINFISLMNTIRTNPNLVIMLNDVLKRIEQIQEVWFKLKPLYSISSTQVGNPTVAATSNGIWYTMLGMTVLPEHLKALKAGLGFSPADAESHQILAKDTTLRIENILAHSDTNLQLLIGSPEMIRVFHRVKDTLSQFSGHTYEAVITHLQSIRDEMFPALLVETDVWEQRLGIVPGVISTPVKKILDQFYLGLIEALNLPSEQQLALASSLVSFDVRAKVFDFKMRVAESELFRLQPFITTLTRFKEAIQAFKPGDDTAPFKQCFELALPLLREQQNLHTLGITRGDEDKKIDELCYQLIPSTNDLEHIKFLTIRCLANYEGRRNTQQFTQEMLKEQRSALLTSKAAQVADNHAYKTQYVTQLLHRQINRYVEEQKEILSLRESYSATLKQFLLSHEEAIVSDLVSRECTQNMQEQIELLLQAPLQQFAETEYRHFMKLQSILVAINAFECYLNQENAKLGRHEYLWFETGATLAAKRAHIVSMQVIAMDATKSAETRLSEIQAILTQPNVQSDLLAYHQYDCLSWDGLKQLFWQLLQTVGLYTPDYQFEYARLNSAASADAPASAQFLRSYGLFNTRRNYPMPQAPQMELTPSTQ